MYEIPSSSVIACEKEGLPGLYLIGERGGRVEGVKETFTMLVLVFFFISSGERDFSF